MSLAFWRDVAIVWLALFCFIGMAVPLAAALFAVKGVAVVLDRTPGVLGKAQGVTRRVRDYTDAGSRQAVTRALRVQHRVQHVTSAIRLLGGSPGAKP